MVNWAQYFFWMDFSAQATELAAIPVGPMSDTDLQTVLTALQAQDTGEGGTLWHTVADSSPWDLAGLVCVSNDLNNTHLPTHPGRQNCMVLTLPVTAQTPVGCMYLCW